MKRFMIMMLLPQAVCQWADVTGIAANSIGARFAANLGNLARFAFALQSLFLRRKG